MIHKYLFCLHTSCHRPKSGKKTDRLSHRHTHSAMQCYAICSANVLMTVKEAIMRLRNQKKTNRDNNRPT